MSFRDDLKDDLDIFVESEEFAEFVTLDGIYLRAQVTAYNSQKSGNRNLNFEGLYGDFVTVYFKTADYCNKKARLPRKNEYVWLNNVRFDVESCRDSLGIARLELSAYRSNVLREPPYRGANPYDG